MAHSDDANLKVIISRIQQRRGLKQELPQPLRPGEIGFATDSRQVYIGADTADATSSTYNKQVVFETTQNAQDLTKSLANSQIIKFEVPHIRFPKGSGNFNSATKQISWNPTTSSTYTISDGTTATRTVFPANVTAPGGNVSAASINQNLTDSTFNAENLTVIIAGKTQTGDDDGSGATVNAAFDYNFISGSGSASDHIINFRSAPANSEDVSISYYGNTQVISLLTAAGAVTSGASTTGFYTAKGIPEWQKLDHNNIFVNGEVGTGYIGLEAKHIDVVGTGSGIANIASVTVGNIIAAKNPSDVSLYGGSATYDAAKYSGTFVTSTVGSSIVTFVSGTTVLGLKHQGDAANPNGSQEYVYIEGLNAAGITEAGYLHQKILPIKNTTDVATSTFIVDTPANTFTVARAVTSGAAGATVTITSNTDGLANGMYVDFAGTNATEFTQNPYIIGGKTGTTFTITNAGEITGAVADNLTVVPFNDISRTNVVVTSAKNGLTTAQNVTFSTAVGTINSATSTAVINADTNTFEVASGDVAETVTGTFSPVLTAITANVGVSPGILLKLAPASGDKTLNSAIADINTYGNWIKISTIPDSTDTTYVRSSDQTEYVLFNDPNDGISSWGNIGINLALATNQKYLKSEKTVKVKFEEWLKTLVADSKPNVLSTVYINNQYEPAKSFGTYDLDINSTTGEIDFDGHEEAGNFSELVNKLYFEKTNANIKGLTTIKTNIELLTNEATAASSATAEYSEPNAITLVNNGVSPVSSLGTDSTIIDTMMVDYVIDAKMSGGLFYNKIGTLQYSANPNADGSYGAVIIQDVGTEYADSGVTINEGVQFTGHNDGSITTSGAFVTGSVYKIVTAGTTDFTAIGSTDSVAGTTFTSTGAGTGTGTATISSATVTISSNVSISPTPGNVSMKYITRRWKSF